MGMLVDYPLLVLVVSLVGLCLAAWAGRAIVHRRKPLTQESRSEFTTILAATLTLLGLIIGFSFSMALERYDQRKNYEEAEANAIGTEYLRIDFLPAADAAAARLLLKNYLNHRVSFYVTRDGASLTQVNEQTARLQQQLWTAVQVPATAQPGFNLALVVSGMNDVLNSAGYTQAAWWNRIPEAAWTLLAVIAVVSNLMIGYSGGKARSQDFLLVLLPFIVSIAFFLIADIDSPRSGMIRVHPQNLLSLVDSLR